MSSPEAPRIHVYHSREAIPCPGLQEAAQHGERIAGDMHAGMGYCGKCRRIVEVVIQPHGYLYKSEECGDLR